MVVLGPAQAGVSTLLAGLLASAGRRAALVQWAPRWAMEDVLVLCRQPQVPTGALLQMASAWGADLVALDDATPQEAADLVSERAGQPLAIGLHVPAATDPVDALRAACVSAGLSPTALEVALSAEPEALVVRMERSGSGGQGRVGGAWTLRRGAQGAWASPL